MDGSSAPADDSNTSPLSTILFPLIERFAVLDEMALLAAKAVPVMETSKAITAMPQKNDDVFLILITNAGQQSRNKSQNWPSLR